MGNEELLENIPKYILKYYDMRVETRTSSRGKIIDSDINDYVINIYTWIIFTPKEITEITPQETNFFSHWKYGAHNGRDRYSYEDAVYIREFEMPILQYISGEYYLDEFCEKMGKNIAEDVVEKSKSQGKTYGKKIPIGQTVHSDFDRNDFVNESNLKESIKRILKEETLNEGGMMDSLKKFFGKKEKTPEDRLVNVITELIRQHYVIDYGSAYKGEETFYFTDNNGDFIFPPIMKYYPKHKSLHYTWDFAEEIHSWIGDDRLVQPDSELIGKVFEKLYKKNVNHSFGFSRL